MPAFHKGKLIPRAIIALLCAALFCGALSVAAAESKNVPFVFENGAMQSSVASEWHVEMDDAWFSAPASTYNHKLAQLSIAMALSAFRNRRMPLGKQDNNLQSFLESAGFTGYESYGYAKRPTDSSISNGIAHQLLYDDLGEYALVAVPVCGQGYGDEWLSNLTVGDLSAHEGFSNAAENVYGRICKYIEKNLTGKRIKIWLTGFSRAAAVSNLTAALLIENPDFEADNIFAYPIACPNNTTTPSAYPQIHNICGSFDPVPAVPLSDWGYGKHGVSHYLPAMENTSNYRDLEARARDKYIEIFGTDEGFAASQDRNWMVRRILNMLLEFMPESQVYSDSYQSGVLAAWKQRGTITDKLKALLDNISAKGKQRDAVAKMRNELLNLLAIGVSDTMQAMNNGESSLWVDVLTSGKNIAHEHQPAVYLAWLLSDDEPDALFGHSPYYHRLIVTGAPAISIVSIDPETDRRMIAYDPSMNVSSLAAIRLANETFIDLPCDHEYEIRISSWSGDVVQIGFGTADVRRVSLPLRVTDSAILKMGETIRIHVPRGENVDRLVEITRNGDTPMPLSESNDYGGTQELHMAGIDDTAKWDVFQRALELSSVIATVASALLVLLYAIIVLIKRMVRGARPDRISCTIWGRVMLYILALAALLLCIYEGWTLASLLRASARTYGNSLLQTASRLYKIGLISYTSFECMVFGLTVLLCCKSVSHGYSRIRLIRLSVLLFLLGLLNSFVTLENNMLSVFATAKLLLPLLAIISVLLARGRHPQGDDISNAWASAIRTFIITGAMFLLYEIVLLLGGAYGQVTGAVKAITGLPILISAALTWKKQRNILHSATFFAALLYMIANVIINFSMLAGLLLHLAGHCTLTYGFVRTKKPRRWQDLVWIALSALLCAQLILSRSYVTNTVLYGGMAYAFMLSAMVVASLRYTSQLWVGTILFLISNELLMLTFRYPNSFALAAIELLAFYIAVLIIVTDSDMIRMQVRHKSEMIEARKAA